jgi:phage baseplate assembly protein W
MSNYRGFSTIEQVKKFKLTDLELVKQNLFNHFNIRKGEKLMQPNFGSVIWSMMFEPLNEETKNLIQADVKKVVGYDPRTRVNNVIVTQFDHGVQLDIEMEYLPTNQSDTLRLSFDNAAQTLTRS